VPEGEVKVAFFVVGSLSSGTTWLTYILDTAPGIDVYHEGGGLGLRRDDKRACKLIRTGSLDASRYLRRRKARMAAALPSSAVVGEVNPQLRYCPDELREVLGCPVVGLVRDGRYVVRSFLWYEQFLRWMAPIKPTEEECAVRWSEMEPLEKAAWYWADSCRPLQESDVPVYRLEDIVSDWEAFRSLCNDCGVEVDREVWEAMRGKRAKPHHNDVPPEWTHEQIEAFLRVAGDVQERYGYPVGGEA
jgi:hypothetical protein